MGKINMKKDPLRYQVIFQYIIPVEIDPDEPEPESIAEEKGIELFNEFGPTVEEMAVYTELII